jgi:GTP cyclohydrolase I
MDEDKIKSAVRMLLEAIGEDPDREALRDTPRRIADLYVDLFGGLARDPARVLKIYPAGEKHEMVLAKRIVFHSVCEHHLLPFLGLAHVAYIPTGGRVAGISQLVKVVEILAHRPQVQERLTNQIADVLEDTLSPEGVLVVLDAEHLCMTLRGVKKPGARIVTTASRGVLRDGPGRAEVFSQIQG